MNQSSTSSHQKNSIRKTPTGISGLDEIIGGGLPARRPTLICGSAGCGKTLLAAEFIVRGAAEYGEPGVLMMFEEDAEELTANVRSLGFDLAALAKKEKGRPRLCARGAERNRGNRRV